MAFSPILKSIAGKGILLLDFSILGATDFVLTYDPFLTAKTFVFAFTAYLTGSCTGYSAGACMAFSPILKSIAGKGLYFTLYF